MDAILGGKAEEKKEQEDNESDGRTVQKVGWDSAWPGTL